jgi:hypothetical protein
LPTMSTDASWFWPPRDQASPRQISVDRPRLPEPSGRQAMDNTRGPRAAAGVSHQTELPTTVGMPGGCRMRRIDPPFLGGAW